MGTDYTAINEVLSFAPGAGMSDMECFVFAPNDDLEVERRARETIEIEASSANPDVVFNGQGRQALIEIIDDDGKWKATYACMDML